MKPSRPPEHTLGPAGIVALICHVVFLILVVIGAVLIRSNPTSLEELESIKKMIWWRGLGMMISAGVGLIALVVAWNRRQVPRILGWILAVFFLGWWTLVVCLFFTRSGT